MGISFRNFTLPINEGIILIFLLIVGISYYCFFWKHHKRNEMNFSEIYPLIINYLVLSIISTLIFILGIDIVLTGYIYNDEVAEVIKELIIGLAIISSVIINFIFYVKRHRIDLIQSDREENEKQTRNIAEWIEFIIFSLFILFSFFNIFKYMSFIDRAERYKNIMGSILCICASIFLLYNLNPLDIKNKTKSLLLKMKGK